MQQDPYARHIIETALIRKCDETFESVAGLEQTKKQLNETIIIPNLRPDLFKDIRSPAKGKSVRTPRNPLLRPSRQWEDPAGQGGSEPNKMCIFQHQRIRLGAKTPRRGRKADQVPLSRRRLFPARGDLH